MRKLKALWGMLKMVKLAWQTERHAIQTLSPRELHERQYVRCVQQVWAWDKQNNDRQVMRFATAAINEGRWLREHGYPLPWVPGELQLDPPVKEALDDYLTKFGY